MNNKKYYKLAYKNVKRSTFRRNVFILVISIFLFIILIPFTLYEVLVKALDLSNEMSDLKTVGVYNVTDADIEYLKNYQNDGIVKIDYNYSLINGFIDFEMYESIYLFEDIENHTPKIINGKTQLEDFEMLCPTHMAYGFFDDLNYSELTKTSINDVYTLSFYKYLDSSGNYESYEHNLKIVSQFDADDTYNYNVCYVNSNTYGIIKEEIYNDSYIHDIHIYAKDHNSALKIASELKLKGMDAQVSIVDTEIMPPLFNFSVILAIFISIASFIAISVYLYSYFKSEYKRLALYKALGFNYKEITSIMASEIKILIVIAFVIDLILFIILAIILELVLKQQIQFRGVYIRLPILPFIIYFLILFINSHILVRYEVGKMRKLTVRELNEE